jgi:hypothetical protein
MNVLYDCYALRQYGSVLDTQLTINVFSELPDDDLLTTETCRRH